MKHTRYPLVYSVLLSFVVLGTFVHSTQAAPASEGSVATGCIVALDCDFIAPTIVEINSETAAGTYGVGSVIDISVTFSELVTSTGDVTVTLETGETDRTCTFTITSSLTGGCEYTVQDGDYTTDLDATISGVIKDISTQDNTLTNFVPATTLAENTDFVIDGVVPYLISSEPADGATDVTSSQDFVIEFSRAVYAGTGNITLINAADDSSVETIDVTDAERVSGTGTTTITIDPEHNIDAATSYYVLIDSTAFEDEVGNTYAGIDDSTTWNFTTAGISGEQITSIQKTDGEITALYENNQTDTIIPFGGKTNFRTRIDPTRHAVIASNGRFIRVFVEGEQVSHKRIRTHKQPRKRYRIFVSELYPGYTSIFVLTTNSSEAKLTALRLHDDYRLTHRKSTRMPIDHQGAITIKRRKNTKQIVTLIGTGKKRIRTVWKLLSNNTPNIVQ